MRILTIVGARPQFVKAAVISRAINEWNAIAGNAQIEEVLVHTGQHHDQNMSQVFFDELSIRHASINLQISGGLHGDMTGKMLGEIERVILDTQPDWLLVYGDTNSTLAGALAAAKLHVPVAHVEAGLRSFNRRMPEEINRVVTDHLSQLLLCPTSTAVDNLRAEGIRNNVFNVGDVMYDASLFYRERAERSSRVLQRFGLKSKTYVLCTCHRAENTDDPARLKSILYALQKISAQHPIILPMHPRTAQAVQHNNFGALLKGLQVVEPVSFLDMIQLEANARTIMTDSGGVQKEAYFFGVPCVTLREETEWVETVSTGWNQLAGFEQRSIAEAFEAAISQTERPILYGEGKAGEDILTLLHEHC